MELKRDSTETRYFRNNQPAYVTGSSNATGVWKADVRLHELFSPQFDNDSGRGGNPYGEPAVSGCGQRRPFAVPTAVIPDGRATQRLAGFDRNIAIGRGQE